MSALTLCILTYPFKVVQTFELSGTLSCLANQRCPIAIAAVLVLASRPSYWSECGAASAGRGQRMAGM